MYFAEAIKEYAIKKRILRKRMKKKVNGGIRLIMSWSPATADQDILKKEKEVKFFLL